ncbi:MAG TPA: PIG-L deacetylase family protein [Chthoniobacterales bacterium]|nr:PIG-L deacetylase family protein [Chthoniobacterales bacterium]
MDKVKTVLALGAHPDDLELGCGATLAKLSASGVAVHAVVFSNGEQGGSTGSDRTAETRSALEALGVASVTQHDFADTRLHESLNDLIACTEAHVRAVAPDRVYTMFHLDRHQDHRTVHEASVVACRKVPQILGYETPSSYPNFMPTVFEPVDDFMEAKIEALKLHASQGERLYMQQEKIRSAAHFRGVQVDLGQTESFIPYKLVL